MSTDAETLRRVRTKLAALDGAQWQLCCDGDESFVEARTRHGELNKIATFHPGALPDEIDFLVSAPDMVTFLLQLVDRAIAKARNDKRQVQNKPNSAKDFAAEAAMKGEDAAFKVFLEQKHGLERPLTADRVAQKLRSILGIQSRKELNQNGEAAQRWRDLRADFEAWRRVGR